PPASGELAFPDTKVREPWSLSGFPPFCVAFRPDATRKGGNPERLQGSRTFVSGNANSPDAGGHHAVESKGAGNLSEKSV
ncbi:MAG: hypothetical protein AAF488_09700, partial [Planctomycetota bacterium]